MEALPTGHILSTPPDAPTEGDAGTPLWQIADAFRMWVCRELNALGARDRRPVRGDYLFHIGGIPRFLVVVEEQGCYSGTIHLGLGSEHQRPAIQFEAGCPVVFEPHTLEALLSGGARTVISTDEWTLKKLLLGTLNARSAFLAGKVQIEGDLPGFMRLVSMLKGRGVKPGVA